ncbi:hypothetical protein BN940_02381 [Castellaniella defragrans 65Phen]|uniref:Uncharacterized protein n=1 Tax=Castellaniella defragrans (strain DSM 12143 / CCUG 39792 / 65Phen) TaxID=1437824 RepID=W8X0Y9_CASD6|nr:hypothetical protein BN940_02381 [Castellaniella defragrans 65Phen]
MCSAHGDPVEPAPAKGVSRPCPPPPAQDGDGRRLKKESRAWRRGRDPSDSAAAPVQRPSGKSGL